ncbi:MAG TPA: LLM class flavin-dependent oxidoreductase [Methylomirabilota bacterium]|nr:LLM class flavin-dependent oxidoreductase [Methylomirabilota bacterium]
MREGFALFAGIAADVIETTAREVEAFNYASFWVNHPGTIDGLAALAGAAHDTSRVALGVGVIPLNTRAPQSIVEGVRANRLPLDRLLLGIGSPNPGSLARVRSGVTELRAALPGVKLVVAALGPKMCELAGEVADAVLFNFVTPEHARASADLVRAGARKAGRGVPTLYSYVRVALGAASRPRLQEEADRYGKIPAYAANFARMGVKPIDTTIMAETPAALHTAIARWHGIVDELVLRAITPTDSVEEIVALVRAARPPA